MLIGKKEGTAKRGRGRPVLQEGLRKDCSLQFRISTSEMRKLELAARLCDFKSRSSWAISRLMVLANSVLASAGIDPSNAAAVQKALGQIEKTD